MAIYFYDKYNVNSIWNPDNYVWKEYNTYSVTQGYGGDTGWIAESNTTTSTSTSGYASVTFSSSSGFNLSGSRSAGSVGNTFYSGYNTYVTRYEVISISGGTATCKVWSRSCNEIKDTLPGTYRGEVSSSNRNAYPDNGVKNGLWYTYDRGSSGYYTYSKGSFIATVQAENGTYPNDGRHTDGYWYVRQGIAYNPPKIWINVNGVMKPFELGYVNINGVMKQVDSVWVNINGVMKKSE